MSNRRLRITESKIEKMIKEGRGAGELETYKPWFKIDDLSPHGLSSQIFGQKTKRIHNFFNNPQLSYFYTAEWSANVVDIREHFPLLPWQDTARIAENLKLKHPVYSGTNQPKVLVTTFLLTVQQNGKHILLARTLLPAKSDNHIRNNPALLIEQEYWNEQKVNWTLVKPSEISKALVKNIQWIRSYRNVSDLGIEDSILNYVADDLTSHILAEPHNPLRRIATECDKRNNLAIGTGISVIKYLIASYHWVVDLNVPIDINKPLQIISIS